MKRATYGMTNAEIVESMVCGTTKTYLVYADTERFGKHEIMAQFPTRRESEEWLRANGVEVEKTAIDMLDEQVGAPFGRVQIGNAMYRRLYRDGDKYMGYSKSDGWTVLNGFFDEAVVTGEGTAKTTSGLLYGWMKSKTIKFGNACTW